MGPRAQRSLVAAADNRLGRARRGKPVLSGLRTPSVSLNASSNAIAAPNIITRDYLTILSYVQQSGCGGKGQTRRPGNKEQVAAGL